MPACVTVKVNPAIVSVPVRDAVAVLAATVYGMAALPEPEDAEMVIQEALLFAVQALFEDAP